MAVRETGGSLHHLASRHQEACEALASGRRTGTDGVLLVLRGSDGSTALTGNRSRTSEHQNVERRLCRGRSSPWWTERVIALCLVVLDKRISLIFSSKAFQLQHLFAESTFVFPTESKGTRSDSFRRQKKTFTATFKAVSPFKLVFISCWDQGKNVGGEIH